MNNYVAELLEYINLKHKNSIKVLYDNTEKNFRVISRSELVEYLTYLYSTRIEYENLQTCIMLNSLSESKKLFEEIKSSLTKKIPKISEYATKWNQTELQVGLFPKFMFCANTRWNTIDYRFPNILVIDKLCFEKYRDTIEKFLNNLRCASLELVRLELYIITDEARKL